MKTTARAGSENRLEPRTALSMTTKSGASFGTHQGNIRPSAALRLSTVERKEMTARTALVRHSGCNRVSLFGMTVEDP
jgi:hypothetical protein